MDILAPLVLLMPLAGFLVNALLGRLLPRRLVGWVGAGSIGMAFVFALVILSQVLGGQKLDQSYFTWWQSADFNVPFNLYVDALLIFLTLRVLDFQGLFSRVHQLPKGGIVITGISLLLLVGAVAKSAQLPLHTWLPDAMEGPTPVSALIHAATMVTAGVYLVARMHLLYDWAPAAAATVAVIGGMTALFAATIG